MPGSVAIDRDRVRELVAARKKSHTSGHGEFLEKTAESLRRITSEVQSIEGIMTGRSLARQRDGLPPIFRRDEAIRLIDLAIESRTIAHSLVPSISRTLRTRRGAASDAVRDLIRSIEHADKAIDRLVSSIGEMRKRVARMDGVGAAIDRLSSETRPLPDFGRRLNRHRSNR